MIRVIACEKHSGTGNTECVYCHIDELESLLPKAYNEGIGEGMREMNSFHGAKDWEETVSFSKMRKAREK